MLLRITLIGLICILPTIRSVSYCSDVIIIAHSQNEETKCAYTTTASGIPEAFVTVVLTNNTESTDNAWITGRLMKNGVQIGQSLNIIATIPPCTGAQTNLNFPFRNLVPDAAGNVGYPPGDYYVEIECGSGDITCCGVEAFRTDSEDDFYWEVVPCA